MPRTQISAIRPRAAHDDVEDWVAELIALQNAAEMMLARKKETFRVDPAMEQVLWVRHRDILARIKRQVDAIAL